MSSHRLIASTQPKTPVRVRQALIKSPSRYMATASQMQLSPGTVAYVVRQDSGPISPGTMRNFPKILSGPSQGLFDSEIPLDDPFVARKTSVSDDNSSSPVICRYERKRRHASFSKDIKIIDQPRFPAFKNDHPSSSPSPGSSGLDSSPASVLANFKGTRYKARDSSSFEIFDEEATENVQFKNGFTHSEGRNTRCKTEKSSYPLGEVQNTHSGCKKSPSFAVVSATGSPSVRKSIKSTKTRTRPQPLPVPVGTLRVNKNIENLPSLQHAPSVNSTALSTPQTPNGENPPVEFISELHNFEFTGINNVPTFTEDQLNLFDFLNIEPGTESDYYRRIDYGWDFTGSDVIGGIENTNGPNGLANIRDMISIQLTSGPQLNIDSALMFGEY